MNNIENKQFKVKISMKSFSHALVFIFLVLISNTVQAKILETYKVDFDNKYLEDFTCNSLDDYIVFYQKSMVKLNKYHPFVKQVKISTKQVQALWEIKSYEPNSIEYFERLMVLMSDKGKSKLLKGFRNYNDQQSQFKRIEIVKELEKEGILTAVQIWSTRIHSKGLVFLTARKAPTYNFKNETFYFKVRLLDRTVCQHAEKVATDKASELGSQFPIYWEAIFYDENTQPKLAQIYYGQLPPDEPFTSFILPCSYSR